MSYLWGSEERDPRAYAAYCVWRGCAVCWAREAGVAPMGAARGARVARGARGTSLAVSAKRCGWSGGGKWAPPRKDRRRGASRSRMPARTRARAHAAGGQPLSSPPEPGLKSCSLLEQRRNANRRAKKEAGEGAEEADDEVLSHQRPLPASQTPSLALRTLLPHPLFLSHSSLPSSLISVTSAGHCLNHARTHATRAQVAGCAAAMKDTIGLNHPQP